MPDIFTPQKRSEVMARIRGRDTKPELALRSMLHRLGYRFPSDSIQPKPFSSTHCVIVPTRGVLDRKG